ncbi:TolC family protein [Anaerobacillus sp. MEB173]|uniref:TolC family protein n=1 Tax=Anaerobacillus sp. MEB173 TaxID=3383345 RepID=UPI003F9072F5
MKKYITTLSLAGLLVFNPFSLAVYADSNNVSHQQSVEEGFDLSLKFVLEKAEEDNSNLLLLQYQWEVLKNQKEQTRSDRDSVQGDIRELRDEIDKIDNDYNDALRDYLQRVSDIETEYGDEDSKEKEDALKELEPLENALTVYNEQKSALIKQREALETQLDQYAKGIKQLEIEQTKSTIQREEAKEGIKVMVTSNYINLLMIEEQLKLSQQSLDLLNKELKALETHQRVGLASVSDVRKLNREIETRKKEHDKTIRDFQFELAKFTFDLGIPYQYQANMKLKPVTVKVKELQKPKKYETLIHDSFQMQIADQNLYLAQYNYDNTSAYYEREQHRYNVKIAEEQIKQLEKDLEKKIDTLYYDLDDAIDSYEDAKRNLEYVKQDIQDLATQYRLGLVSKHDYEKAFIEVEQAQFEVAMAEKNYFMMLQLIEAMKKGFFQ